MAPQMKGLTQFIVDLRNSNNAEEERKRINLEISNIQSKFAISNLNSYQKKKYVCKLIYIHLLGFEEDTNFGLKQAYALAESSDFLEKQLGYLLISILFKRDATNPLAYIEGLFEQTHVHLLRDLKIDKEAVNCLALQFIASNFNVMIHLLSMGSAGSSTIGIYGQQWLDLIDMVYGFCVSPVSSANIRKKALITLLVMIKITPKVITINDNWIPRLLALLDDANPSVVLSAIPLTKYLTDVKPQYIKSILPTIAARLERLVVNRSCPLEYLFYDIPAPWLVTRLLQLTEHFLLPSEDLRNVALSVSELDSETLSKLRNVVSTSIQTATGPSNGQPGRNSQSSILFQAVALASLLDASSSAIEGAVGALISLLDFPDTNLRYLVLDALTKLSARSNPKASFKDHMEKIFASLYDRDVSIRRKTVDLLYTMCEPLNYGQIVSKLLDYLPVCDSTLRNEISIKVAVIAEKYASDPLWYVSTMLRLLSICGNSKPNSGDPGTASEIWERIAQIIVNNEDLQKMTGKYIMNTLKKPKGSIQDGLYKVAAFVLGEYGHKLAESADQNNHFTLEVQFTALMEAYFNASLSARPLIMSAFIKFIVKSPNEDFVPDILDLFEAEAQSLDLEIQTRAHEYLKVASYMVSGDQRDIEFARSIVAQMPPFTSKRNKLLNHLGSVKHITERSYSTVNVLKIPKLKVKTTGHSSSNDLSDVEDLSNITEDDLDPFHDPQPRAPQLSPNWYAGYHRMLQYDAGIFYEDQLVKITYRTIKEGPDISIIFTVINNASKTADANITAFTVLEVCNMSQKHPEKYAINLVKVPDPTIPQKTTLELKIKVREVLENTECPIICFTYKCSGSFNKLNLKIPIVLIKTLSGTSLSSLEDFRKRWLQIGELLGTVEGEKKGVITTNHRYTSANMVRMIQRIGFAIVHSTPDNAEGVLVMGAGILRTLKSNYGLLLTIKSTDVMGRLFDVAVRSTGGGVLEIIFQTLKEMLESK